MTSNDDLSKRLEAVEKELAEMVDTLRKIQEAIEPTINSLKNNPMLSMLFGRN